MCCGESGRMLDPQSWGNGEKKEFFFFKLLEVCAAVGFSHHLT